MCMNTFVRLLKMASKEDFTIVKNKSGKSPEWQYFGFYKNQSGVLLQGAVFVKMNYLIS